ncbi:MAG: MOSC domain-containing protein [Thermoplasmata archaeon]|nr:MOSC domain-containing protein [Thermoplasmata archaeon]
MGDAPTVVAISVGMPAPTLRRGGEPVVSAIIKRPVDGRVRIDELGPEGDGHANPAVHGGIRKAVYAYPMEHYAFWRAQRPELSFPVGAFGENLTTQGLLESELRPGDRLEIGTTRMVVTQPRFPCEKLGLRFVRPSFVREFAEAGRSGFYLSVERGGTVAAGDEIRFEPGGSLEPTIEAMFRAKA